MLRKNVEYYRRLSGVGNKFVPTPYKRLQNFSTFCSNILARCSARVIKLGEFPNFMTLLLAKSVDNY